MNNHKDIDVYISSKEIDNEISNLAKKINSDFKDQQLTLICILRDSFMFFADLIRKVDVLNLNTCFVKASSYRNSSTKTSQTVQTDTNMLDAKYIENRNVLIIEDIVDTGRTYHSVMDNLRKLNPKSLNFASLLFKPERLETDVDLYHYCFEVKNQFIVGYGLAFDEKYRELPYIGVIK